MWQGKVKYDMDLRSEPFWRFRRFEASFPSLFYFLFVFEYEFVSEDLEEIKSSIYTVTREKHVRVWS